MATPTLSISIRKLEEACETLEDVFSECHSFSFLLRSARSGPSFAGQWRKLMVVKEGVRGLAMPLWAEEEPDSSPQGELVRMYWCYVYIAASVLVEWATRSDRDFREGERYRDRERQVALRRYLGAIKEAKRIRKQLGQVEAD